MTSTNGVGGASRSSSSAGTPGSADNDSGSNTTSAEAFASEPSTTDSLSGFRQGDYTGFDGNEGQTSTESLAAAPTTADSLAAEARVADTYYSPQAEDLLVDQVSNVGAGLFSADARLNGLSVADSRIVDSMKFGRYAENSLNPNRGYSLQTFTRPGGASYYSMNTMISSQASWQNARMTDPTLTNTQFEVPSPNTAVNRTYDRAFGDTLFEDKAGKSISNRQLALDVDLASSGRPVNYVFSGNPLTGNHGPNANVASTLDAARLSSGGRLTTTVSEVAVSPRTVSAVRGASHASVALRGASRLAGPAAAAMDGYNILSTAQQHGAFSKQTAAVVTETSGAWAGAAGGGFAGAKGGAVVGAMIGGPAGAAVGAVAGGIVGAVGGAIAGSTAGKAISSWLGW